MMWPVLSGAVLCYWSIGVIVIARRATPWAVLKWFDWVLAVVVMAWWWPWYRKA